MVVIAPTESHVDYLNQINNALDWKRRELRDLKGHSDIDAVIVLLFKDLNRKSIILSLIEDRGMLTADEMSMALDDIETRPAALWEGAL